MSSHDQADNETPPPPGPDRVGQVMKQKWRIDELIGAGGMASVYAATHRNGNRVAIKVLHPQYVVDQSLRSRFQREGYVANLIDHAAVVRVLDDDVTDDGAAFLVMELLEGETLASRLHRESIVSLDDALIVAYQVLDVLAAAHPKGIVHRDIKPDNIFLTSSGQIKVLDFGIARLADRSGANQTRAGALLGTPAYMAPEQALEDPSSVDGQTDVWAVGATMFRMLTGRTPRGGTTFSQQLYAAASQPVPPLQSKVPDASPAICEVVDRATAFHRNHRWPSAVAMQMAIQPHLRVIPPRVPPAGPLVVTQPQMLPRFTAPMGEVEGPVRGDHRANPSFHSTPTTHNSAQLLPAGEVQSRNGAQVRPPARGPGRFLLVAAVLALALVGGGWFYTRGSLPGLWTRPPLTAADRNIEFGTLRGSRAPGAPVPAAKVPAVPGLLPSPAKIAPLPPSSHASSLAPAQVAPAGDSVDSVDPRSGRPHAAAAPPRTVKTPTRAPTAKANKRASRPSPPRPLMDDDELLGRRH